MHIAGKVAIVTGGSRGFGKAFSEAILSRGGKVCFADVNVAEGAKTLNEFKSKYGEGNSAFVKCDVTKEAEFKEVFRQAREKFKTVHIMVNNAGILNETNWDKTIDINLKAMMLGTYLAVEHMRKDKGGEGGIVLNVSSAAGFAPAYFMPAYAASKHGVVGFTRSWAMNPFLKNQYGMSFACLCPAFSDTDMLKTTLGPDVPAFLHPEQKQLIISTIDRLGVNSIEDVVDAFLELIEKENCNGDVLSVNKLQGTKYMFNTGTNKL